MNINEMYKKYLQRENKNYEIGSLIDEKYLAPFERKNMTINEAIETTYELLLIGKLLGSPEFAKKLIANKLEIFDIYDYNERAKAINSYCEKKESIIKVPHEETIELLFLKASEMTLEKAKDASLTNDINNFYEKINWYIDFYSELKQNIILPENYQ